MTPSGTSTPFVQPEETITVTQVGDGHDALIRFSNGSVYDIADLDTVLPPEDAIDVESHYFPGALARDETERAALVTELRALGTRFREKLRTRCPREWERIELNHIRIAELTIEGDASFHRLPWELVYDPHDGSLQRLAVVRRLKGSRLLYHSPPLDSGLRVLVVTARPWLPDDISLRAVVQPMIDAGLWVVSAAPRIDVLRGGTWSGLEQRLLWAEAHGWPYQIVHFDMHGAVGSRGEIERAVRTRDPHFRMREGDGTHRASDEEALLFFEQSPTIDERRVSVARADARSAGEIADLLRRFDVQVAVLVTCESSARAAVTERANLAMHLIRHGVPAAVGMRHKLTASGARVFTEALYETLASSPERDPLTTAVKTARSSMRNKFDSGELPLDESSLPAVFIGRTPFINVRPASDDDSTQQRANRELLRRQEISRLATYGVVGRTMDHWVLRSLLFDDPVYSQERRNPDQAASRIVSVSGLAGIGKSTVVRDLVRHWDNVNYVDHTAVVDGATLIQALAQETPHHPDIDLRSDVAVARALCRELDRAGLEDPVRGRRSDGHGDDPAESDPEASLCRRLGSKAEVLVVFDKVDEIDTPRNTSLGSAIERVVGSIAVRRNWAIVVSRIRPSWLRGANRREAGVARVDPFQLLGLDARAAVDLASRATRFDAFRDSRAARVAQLAAYHPRLIIDYAGALTRPDWSESQLRGHFRDGTGELLSASHRADLGWDGLAEDLGPFLHPFAAFRDPQVFVGVSALARLLEVSQGPDRVDEAITGLVFNGLLAEVDYRTTDAQAVIATLQEHGVLDELHRTGVIEDRDAELHPASLLDELETKGVLVEPAVAAVLGDLDPLANSLDRSAWQLHPALPYLSRTLLRGSDRSDAAFSQDVVALRQHARTALTHRTGTLWSGRQITVWD